MRRGPKYHRAPPWMSVEERFWFKVHKTENCWNWMASRNRHGYGMFGNSEGSQLAHRWLFERTVCPVPEGFELDHLCRNPMCVRPDHLEMVTHRENVLRGNVVLKKKTHCKYGHPFDEENTYHHPRGMRQCRTCQKGFSEWRMKWRRNRKANAPQQS